MVQRRDSAGIVIIETPSPAARAPIGWSIDQMPDLQLGSAAGPEAEQFDQIGGVSGGGIAGLPDGRIAVLNAGSGELLFFGREGRFLNRVGRKGRGPGEFRAPYLIPYASNDSLLVSDVGQRFTLFSNDGQINRSFIPNSLPTNLIRGTIGGASESGIVMTNPLDTSPMVKGSMGEGQRLQTMAVRWFRLESGHAEVVAQFNKQSYFVKDLGGMPYDFPVPFTTGPSAAVGVQGFFVTGGDTPEVRAFDNSGRLIRIFRLAEHPRPVTRADIDGAVDSSVAHFSPPLRSQVRSIFKRMDIPSGWPAFQTVRVDRLGWIWAELFRPRNQMTPRWMVFDSSGVARGVIDLPHGLEVHDIGADYVLGRWRDDLRVEYVRRYRLDRTHLERKGSTR